MSSPLASPLASPRVLFFDNHLLVAFKPPGMPTQPTPQSGSKNLEDWTKQWLKKETKKEGNVFLTCIHRLDKPACGLVLFARSSKALSRLNEMMRERKIQKKYLAQIEGRLPAQEGRLEHYLVHDDFVARVVSKESKDAKRAILTYKQIAPQLVEIDLETGRYHQIRAQLSSIGCPIVGDRKYGSSTHHRAPGIENAIALQHAQLQFVHPVTKAPLSFVVPAQLILRSERC